MVSHVYPSPKQSALKLAPTGLCQVGVETEYIGIKGSFMFLSPGYNKGLFHAQVPEAQRGRTLKC